MKFHKLTHVIPCYGETHHSISANLRCADISTSIHPCVYAYGFLRRRINFLHQIKKTSNCTSSNAEELTKKLVEIALDGDVAALRICMDRLIPKVANETFIEAPEHDPDMQQLSELIKQYEREY